METQNLQSKIKKIIRAAEGLKPGTVTHIVVKHEPGCPALVTESMEDCRCNPTIEKMGNA